MTKVIKRTCPNKMAKEFKLKTVKKGLDGKQWIVSKRSDGIKYWKKLITKKGGSNQSTQETINHNVNAFNKNIAKHARRITFSNNPPNVREINLEEGVISGSFRAKKKQEKYTAILAKQLTDAGINLSAHEALSELTKPGVSSNLSKKGAILSRDYDTAKGTTLQQIRNQHRKKGTLNNARVKGEVHHVDLLVNKLQNEYNKNGNLQMN